MKTRVFALGALLATSITGAACVLGANGSPSTDRIDVVSSDANGDGSTSVRVATRPEASKSRKVLGAWLFAMTSAAAVLGAYRSRPL